LIYISIDNNVNIKIAEKSEEIRKTKTAKPFRLGSKVKQ